jgi:hypothetical protein
MEFERISRQQPPAVHVAEQWTADDSSATERVSVMLAAHRMACMPVTAPSGQPVLLIEQGAIPESVGGNGVRPVVAAHSGDYVIIVTGSEYGAASVVSAAFHARFYKVPANAAG